MRWQDCRVGQVPEVQMLGTKLLARRCLIRPDYQTSTAGGLALPDIYDGRQSSGVVLDAGTTDTFDAGDRVIFSRVSAAPVGTDDEDLLLVNHDDVMAVVI